MTNKHDKAIIAFSGGLDTSMLVPYMRENYGVSHITTCVVDTGAMTEADKKAVADRAKEVKSDEHVYIDATQAFYDEIIKYLIFGNVSRDGYPLCVGSERLIQARETIRFASKNNIYLMAHGSTGAGNDQYRFDLVAHVEGKNIESVAPVREFNIKREFSQNFLRERGISVSDKAKYSYNVGLWGVSIGGEETHQAQGLIPEHAWHGQVDTRIDSAKVKITFEQGEPIAVEVDGKTTEGAIDVIRTLGRLGGAMGIGRHYHLGTSIPGKKGRLAFESPAADILYEAHRTLEKHVMTQSQIFFKQGVAQELGRLIHEAYFYDPLADDIRAFLTSSQKRVSGVCTVYLKPYRIESVTADTPYDLLTASGSLYGEFSDYYDARDAQGSAKLHAYEQLLYAGRKNK
ncbi:MAG: argininosuccinate synthase [Alphaproteobacteria bacterium]|nr:argininosuccinate synthase [Alphaproteobacteria bacterium]NCQ89142.1 argininosuccinate synthase [Alphaproteobacteria bacterium]NCT08246.1 argininosuccinate synthase [Alphaproteobacteria bacterium]